MNVTLISCFRNSTSYLERYFNQVADLYLALVKRHDKLSLILGEGDSTDDTLAELERMAFNAQIVDCTHGGKDYPSVASPERFRQLAHVGNCLWEHIPLDSDVILYVESDLIWDAADMVKLIDQTRDYPAISPMVYLRRVGYPANAFYDTYVYRKDGLHFGHYFPYVAGFDPDRPFVVDSAGSAMAIRGDLARQLVWDEDVFVGICAQIYQLGGSVWCNPLLQTIHN